MLPSRAAQSTLRATAHQLSSTRVAVRTGARTYATTTTSPKPPIALFGIDGTYANALELQRVAGGPGKDNILNNFLSTLAENNRLGVLQGVCEKFAALMSAHNGEIELVITSAQKLDTKTLQRLEAAVAKSEYSQGKKLKVVSKVCESGRRAQFLETDQS
ncbi:ATP synthase subunit 5 [Histoplasma capsulatum H143]|uniref:ATP synthase subunit 5, mitochondrial n=1 Tax=Ajellomyces capsulatus (strain H143) TaxID=544712 RepID=C6HJU9_AJECH|nr:ATP synthase subunit 5 [Histoplasma capsulatum H143]